MHYSVCDYVSDLTQNSIEALGTVIIVEVKNILDELEVTISDNGKGMTAQTLENAKNPFYSEEGKHNQRKVGLGIPFIVQAVELLAGSFDIKSQVGFGTSINFKYKADHVDAPPLGKIDQMLLSLMSMPGEFELVFKRVQGGKKYMITRSELLDVVGDINEVSALQLVKQYLAKLELDVEACSCSEGCKAL